MREADRPRAKRVVVVPRPPRAPRFLVVGNPYEMDVDVASLEPELVAVLAQLERA